MPFISAVGVLVDQGGTCPRQRHCTRIRPAGGHQPGFWGGSWRIWGSGDLHTWFPLDGARPNRDRIFIMFLRNRYWRIGFTVEHSNEVTEILKGRGLLREPALS